MKLKIEKDSIIFKKTYLCFSVHTQFAQTCLHSETDLENDGLRIEALKGKASCQQLIPNCSKSKNIGFLVKRKLL